MSYAVVCGEVFVVTLFVVTLFVVSMDRGGGNIYVAQS